MKGPAGIHNYMSSDDNARKLSVVRNAKSMNICQGGHHETTV